MKSNLRFLTGTFFTILIVAYSIAYAHPTTFWTTGAALMPGWGLYPNGSEYGGTKPLGGHSAWLSGKLTWVANFAEEGLYHVWERQYTGYGKVLVSVDEKPVTGGKGGGGRACYAWFHVGAIFVSKGWHHVDIDVMGTMFDAVLLTTDSEFHPDKNPLPDPVKTPEVRAPRRYRDDSHLKPLAGKKGFVIAAVPPYDEHLNDFAPTPDHLIDRVRLWGAANQYIGGTFAVRMLEEVKEMQLVLASLSGPNKARIGPEDIDLRIVHIRKRRLALFEGGSPVALCPDLLLRDDRTQIPPKGKQGGYGGGVCTTSIPAHESRQFWLTVHVPAKSPSGDYSGNIVIQIRGQRGRNFTLPVTVEVLPVELLPIEGNYSIYYPSQFHNPKADNYVTSDRYLCELKDQVRHGLNATTLYSGEAGLPLAKQAGMTEAPCIMHWPDSNARANVEKAKQMGFTDLYYYGVDEPNTKEAIERCRKEAERRLKEGLHMYTAINSHAAREATKDFIDRPVYNIYVFGGRNSEAAMYARSKGFQPVSYWTTAVSFPLWYRALAGLYNTACGYLGTAPWAYQDCPGNELYSAEQTMHAVAYPDELGDPIPTVRWEAHRDGIDDVRYLQALDRAIATAQGRLQQPAPPAALTKALTKAQEVRKTRFECIEGRWFEYLCRLKPDVLDRTRREMADAIVAINRNLRQ